MNRYAIIAEDTVSNVVIWDGVAEWEPPAGTTVVALVADEYCEIGWIYDPKTTPRFSPPNQ